MIHRRSFRRDELFELEGHRSDTLGRPSPLAGDIFYVLHDYTRRIPSLQRGR